MKTKTSNKVKKLKLVIYSILLIAMSAFIMIINRCGLQAVEFGNNSIPVGSFSGVLTVFMLLVCLVLLNIDNKAGFVIATIVNCFQLLSVSFAVFVMKNMDSVAGVPMSAGIIGLLIMQHNHIKKTEQNEKRLYALSATDPLTGLYNRRSIIEHVNELISARKPFRLLFFDLDNFKNINDTMGHASGDTILCEATRRWTEVADENVLIGRTGGDEFAMVVSGKSDDEIGQFAEKCLSVLAERICTENFDYYATGSAGMARYPEDGNDCESLFRFADTAMYKAKSKGKNQLCFFDENMLLAINRDLKVENEIRSALKYNRFYLVFQPQYETETKRLRGFETLLRLKDETGVPIPPSDFIPVAERSGLIFEIDRWVLRHAMQSFSEEITGNSDFIVSVNISARHIVEPGFAEEVKYMLEENNFPPERLEIEVTESCFIASIEKAISTLLKIKSLGVQIALDDFGTGYASLSYLQKLPIDLLKIDKSFIDDMTDREEGGNFVKSIIAIGHMFHCKVISEGVEEEQQLELLKELKCDYIQGYLWGKPQKQSDALQLIP